VGRAALAADKKRAKRQHALIGFQDESGVSLLPAVRATWAPRGQTPVLHHHFGWKRLSVSGALVYEPDGSDAQLFFALRPGAYDTETLIQFLSDLGEHVHQRRTLLLWGGLPAHRSRHMTEWLASQRTWLQVERSPGYAPELNPTERVWGSIKSTELANLCADTIDEVEERAANGLDRITNDAPLCLGFLHHCGLRL
jgi:transposase